MVKSLEDMIEYFIKGSESAALRLHHCGHETCKSGHSFGPAVRVHYLLHYILEGSGKYYVNGKCHVLHKGQAFLIVPNVSTYYVADKETPWEYCWVGFDGYEAKTLLANCGFSDNLILKEDKNDVFGSRIPEMIRLFSQREVNDYEATGLLYLAFSALIQSLPRTGTEENTTEKAAQYIQNNHTYPITVTDIAKHVGVSRSYLYKLFVKRFSLSPQEYIMNCRLNNAAVLLQKRQYNITEVAFSCGFQNASAFSKQFKKHFGVSPKEYKQERERM